MIKSNYLREMTNEDYKELKPLYSSISNQFTEVQKEVIKHPLNLKDKQGTSHSLVSNLVFKCNTCEEIGMQPWYQMIINTIGGSPLHRSSTAINDLLKGNDGSNLLRILENVSLPNNVMASGLNYLEGEGYVCDHCMTSVYLDPTSKNYIGQKI